MLCLLLIFAIAVVSTIGKCGHLHFGLTLNFLRFLSLWTRKTVFTWRRERAMLSTVDDLVSNQ